MKTIRIQTCDNRIIMTAMKGQAKAAEYVSGFFLSGRVISLMRLREKAVGERSSFSHVEMV